MTLEQVSVLLIFLILAVEVMDVLRHWADHSRKPPGPITLEISGRKPAAVKVSVPAVVTVPAAADPAGIPHD